MDLLSFVVLTILFRETIGGDFTISDGKTDWTTASKQCTLATPDLIFSPDKITVEIDESIADEVWVGYYQATTVFEYYGCAVMDNMLSTVLKKSDPRQCLLACGTDKIIGIFGYKCFCFEKRKIPDNKQTMRPGCNKECDHLKGIVCGGSSRKADGKTYLSLYRVIDVDFPSVGEIKKDWNCMYYQKSGFYWSDCSPSHAFICGTGSTVEKSGNVYHNWTDATTECFRKKTRPSTYNNTRSLHIEQTSAQLWTGVARSQEIYKYTNSPSHLGQSVEYIYLKKTESGMVLKLTNVTDIKKSLCANVTSSANAGAIVGATLSVVAVIVVVVVVVLFIRKRGFQLPYLKKGKQTSNIAHNSNAYGKPQPDEILPSPNRTNQEDYAEINLTTTIDNEARNCKLNDAPESSDYAHDYSRIETPEEEPYDSTKAGYQKSDPNIYNPYNKLSFEKSSNYDHIGAGNAEAGNVFIKVSDSENAYNTTTLGNSYQKTSGCKSNNAYNMAEETEDTYNHTNVPKHEMGLKSSENDYDAI